MWLELCLIKKICLFKVDGRILVNIQIFLYIKLIVIIGLKSILIWISQDGIILLFLSLPCQDGNYSFLEVQLDTLMKVNHELLVH